MTRTALIKLSEQDDIKTGVIEPVLDDADLPDFFALLAGAIRAADAGAKRWFIVRSLHKIYRTAIPPESTTDIDALYLMEVRPAGERCVAADAAFRALLSAQARAA